MDPIGLTERRIPRAWDTLERWALGCLLAFSAIAVLGFATFGRNPQLLALFPAAGPIFSVSFRVFSVGQILLAAAVLIGLLARRVGVRWVPAFAAIYLISLTSELGGTAFGFPFGNYDYTAALGPRWLGLVPLVIPVSWFMMAIPSYALGFRLTTGGNAGLRVMLGAVILTAWDLALDPAMSHATVYWRWESDGSYYGMPWVNLVGWLFTSLLLMGAMEGLRTHRWIGELPVRWLAIFYAANVALPLGMAAAAGLVWAVVVTVAAYGALGLLVWIRSRLPGPRPAEAR